MRSLFCWSLVAAVVCGWQSNEVFAKPGRGGGPGAGAGAGVRPSGEAQRPTSFGGAAERQKAASGGAFGDAGRDLQSPPASRQQLNQFLNPAGEGARNGANLEPAERQGERAEQFQSSRKGAERQLSNHEPLSAGWYKDHPNAWKYAHPYAGAAAIASAATLGRWFGYGAVGGVYDPADDNYDDYATDASTPSDAEQVAQATSLAQVATDEVSTDDADWLSLGVYALVRDERAQPNVLVQLSVNRDGVVRGSWYDVKSDSTQGIQGSVDKSTQTVAFAAAGDTGTVFETTVGNLTEDSAPILIHFSNGQTQKWLTIRQAPQAEAK